MNDQHLPDTLPQLQAKENPAPESIPEVAGSNFLAPEQKVFVRNRSIAQRAARLVLGPTARVWFYPQNDIPISIGVEKDGEKLVTAFGDTYSFASESMVLAWIATPTKSFEEGYDRFVNLSRAGVWVDPAVMKGVLSARFPLEWKAYLETLEDKKDGISRRQKPYVRPVPAGEGINNGVQV